MTTQSPAQTASVAAANGTPLLPGTVLAAAILTTGLMAGVFGLYTHTIMPGLRHTDDRTFVGAFQSIDRAIIAVVITMAVNVPLNDALRAAGDPARIGDLAQVRQHFNEARWSAWNLVRTVTSTAAFGCLIGAAMMHRSAK